MSTVQTALGIISWCFIFIAFLVFLSIFITVFKSRQIYQNVSLLLICNTCLAALLTCLTVCIMVSSNLTTGFLINNLNFCYTWGLFYDIFECSIYYSYCLQSIYRLCRIVFYKKKSLTSYSLYIMLTIGQWLLTVTLLIPPIPLNWYSLLPTEKYCLIPYTNVNAEVYHIVILYVIPLVCISTTYTWIIIFIRHISRRTSTILIAAQQQQRNLRDLTIVKNIVILVSILALLRFPTIIFMINGIISGQLYPLTYSIVGFITSACLIVIGLMTIYITPPLRKNILIIFIFRNSRSYVQNKTPKASQMSIAVVGDVPNNRQDTSTNLSRNADVEHKF